MYEIDGDEFGPRPFTRGGWSDDAQHGSPPSGLLARAVEMTPTVVPMQVVRFTVDLFRPVPLAPLTVETEVLRQGRRIQVVEARLMNGPVEVGRATALKVRVSALEGDDVPTGTAGDDTPPRPNPAGLPRLEWRGTFGETEDLERFHIEGVDIRTIDNSFLRFVPGETWFRLRSDLVAGESITPFQRAAITADLANGNSQALDPRVWLYVNPDITLYLSRLPEGEWLAMRSVAHQSASGIGVTETALYDEAGRVGHIFQAQVLERH